MKPIPFLAGLLAISSAWAAEPGKPNIVVILADDVGYGDLGCYGAKLQSTPNLDRLAAAGCRFTDAHSNASTCTPTRYALLTGKYAFRHGPGSRILPGDAPLSIAPGEATVASILKGAGYATGIVGKWHLGLGPAGGPDWNGDIKPGPLDIGFDYAFHMAATGDRVPCVYIEDRRVVGLDPADPIKVSYANKVGTDPTGRENPDLLKLKPTQGHDMTIVNGISRIGWMSGGKAARWVDEDMADTFTRKAIGFIERNKDRPFFLYFATHDAHVPRVPHQRFRGTSKAGNRGDTVQELDACVGEVMAALDRLKLTDDTLIIFTSDNGGVMDDGYHDVGNFEHSCNGALRGRKGQLYEGGHRVPFIARLPGRIKPGSTCDSLIVHFDMAATLAALAGAKVPAGGAPDSVNVLAALLEGKPGRDHAVFHNGGTAGPFAIRKGSWKYLPGVLGGADPKSKKKAGAEQGPQLYNLADDPAETKNLSAAEPAKVKELAELLARIRAGP